MFRRILTRRKIRKYQIFRSITFHFHKFSVYPKKKGIPIIYIKGDTNNIYKEIKVYILKHTDVEKLNVSYLE